LAHLHFQDSTVHKSFTGLHKPTWGMGEMCPLRGPRMGSPLPGRSSNNNTVLLGTFLFVCPACNALPIGCHRWPVKWDLREHPSAWGLCWIMNMKD